MDIAVTPGGPLGCDGEELVLDDACDALAGYEVCADETVHEDECASDLDCVGHEDRKCCAYSRELERWACAAYAWCE